MQDEMKEMLQSLKSDTQMMKEAVIDTNERLKRVEDEQQIVKRAMIETHETVNNMKDDIYEIKVAVMETNQAVQRLESIQESQHRIIEMLSARSLEHESQLKRIK